MTDIGRNKIIVLDDRFHTGEPTIQPVVLWGLHGKPLYEPLSKEASQSPALAHIRGIQPVPGRTIVLVIGLGSYEWYGLNRNGDGFNEQPYKQGMKPTCGCCGQGRDAWVLEEECVQHHYKSYEQGHVYRHHQNKDPRKCIGHILKAFWNPYMHRVEILEDIDNTKAPDLVEQIADGEFPAKSMGCRIRFDVCTKCGHQAPTRKNYCDHLKWEMGHLDPLTGVRYGALNPNPRLFDSSWVIRPADRTGYMLKKVAYELQGPEYDSSALGDLVDELNAKVATVNKLAVIDKIVRGYPAGIVSGGLPEAPLIEKYRNESAPSVVSHTPELSHGDLSQLAQHNLPDVLATLSRNGILLTTPEFVQLFIEKALPGTRVPRHVLDNLVALQSEIFELFSQHPSLLQDLEGALTPGHATSEIENIVAPLMEKRSTMESYITRRLGRAPGISELRRSEAPTTDLMSYTDPETGRVFQTTSGAALDAQESVDKANLYKLLGSGGLMAGALKALTLPGGKLGAIPLAAGSYLLGSSAFNPIPAYTTDKGYVPYLTEFQEKRSSLIDTVNALAMDYGLTKTGHRTLQRAHARITEQHPLHLFMQKLSSFGLQHPQLTLHNVVAAHEKTAQNGITDDRLDLAKTAEVIGTLAWVTT